MEMCQFRYFLAVAEAGSFTRAAERCSVAQPSLSQQISKFERELGFRLFDRLPRGALLTDAGRVLLPRARSILAEVNEIASTIRTDVESGVGPLRVGAIPTMAPFLMPPLVKRFTSRFPDCDLSLREDFTENVIAGVLDYTLDLAIVSTPIENETVQLNVLGRERLLLVAAADFALPIFDDSLTIADLRDQPAVVLHEMHCLGQQIESFCSTRRLKRRIVCRTTQLDTVLRLVELGLGISLVPEMCAHADGSKTRQYRAFGGEEPSREIAVAYRVDRSLSRLSREFIDMLRGDIEGGIHCHSC